MLFTVHNEKFRAFSFFNENKFYEVHLEKLFLKFFQTIVYVKDPPVQPTN